MNTYKYQVILSVEVEGFDESEAWEAIQDNFGIGQGLGLTVLECEYREA